MGIGDEKRVLERWLYEEVAPSAFYFALPSNVRINMISHDLTARIHGSFCSLGVLSTRCRRIESVAEYLSCTTAQRRHGFQSTQS